jgi:hypothetical protein
MGTIKTPSPVQFFASIIFNDSGILSHVMEELSRAIGPIEETTDQMAFSQSDYYAPEMGDRLMRCFVLFQPLTPREQLVEIKRVTNGIEERHGREGRRQVNIDPGYIALEHVVLATTKGYSHRVYLGRGIFADLTLMYENGTYRSLPWTYPDYAGDAITPLMNRWREHYKRMLRCQKA